MTCAIRLSLCFALVSLLHGQTERWWEREPLRLVDLVTGMDGINFLPAPEVAARKAALGYNSEHFDVMRFVPGGMDDTGFFFKVEFQARSIAAFLRDSRRIIKAKSPDLAFYMNGGARGSNWATGRLNRVIMEYQDILGSEGGFIYGDLTQIPLWKPGLTARLLETQAPAKPRVIFNAAAHKPWTYSVLPASRATCAAAAICSPLLRRPCTRNTAPTGESLVTFVKSMAGPYDGLPGLSGEPALVVNRYGKGTSVYSPGDLGASLHGFHFAEFYQLMENAARMLAPPAVKLENAPGSLEVVLRSQKQGRRLLPHLVNFTGEMTRPIRRVLPVVNLNIRLRGYGPFQAARTLVGKQHLLLRESGPDAIAFSVPRVNEYEVVVLEK